MARFATIERAGKEHGVSYYTIHDRIKSGKIPVYKLPGQAARCVDLDEVAAYFALHPPKVRDYGSFGPDARVRDLSNVVAQFEVLR
ncbi:MAG: hypothetical protein JWM19_602 [Actinomycetia bacterium]|nr:hypothetical protein [Actinomycetes bacterium]